ncbi:MAG TPA: amidase [Polyangiales bacterium]|nr:amidase [Polyangiales bacterium]
MTAAICQLPARILAARIAAGELSAREVTAAHLERIAALNPGLNAVVSLDAEGARSAAAAADRAVAAGAKLGPLHGVPITLKDSIDVAGMRTTIGSSVFDRMAERDSAVAERLRSAGAIILGHTNVPPFLSDYQTDNGVFGRTDNPWDRTRTPGGSSGGAAAALAVGMSALDVGSDLAGSLRLPASFCGVYALKTTELRVSMRGFFRPLPGVPPSVRILSGLGPIARDLGDIELALSILAGPDAEDADLPPVPLAIPPNARRRLAISLFPDVEFSSSYRRRMETLAHDVRAQGIEVVDRTPALEWNALHALFRDLVGTLTGLFDPGAKLRDEQRTLAWYLGALEARDRFVAALQPFFADCDAWILPSAIASAFAHAAPFGQIEVEGRSRSYSDHAAPLVFCNLFGLPSLTVPAGIDELGLPIGVQLVGPRWSEPSLIAIARELERSGALPGFRAPPNG